MKTVRHWWNGSWGRLFRRDVWIKTDGTSWRVEVRQGDGDGRLWGTAAADEKDAYRRAAPFLVRGADEWRDLSPQRPAGAPVTVRFGPAS